MILNVPSSGGLAACVVRHTKVSQRDARLPLVNINILMFCFFWLYKLIEYCLSVCVLTLEVNSTILIMEVEKENVYFDLNPIKVCNSCISQSQSQSL